MIEHDPGNLRVALADDEGLIVESLERLLVESGYDVVGTAADGPGAVDMAERLRPDVLLLDLRMPGLTGIEVAALLQKTLPALRVIILSAYDDAGLQLAAERVPVAAYLVKGCSARAIFRAIGDAISQTPPTDQTS